MGPGGVFGLGQTKDVLFEGVGASKKFVKGGGVDVGGWELGVLGGYKKRVWGGRQFGGGSVAGFIQVTIVAGHGGCVRVDLVFGRGVISHCVVVVVQRRRGGANGNSGIDRGSHNW